MAQALLKIEPHLSYEEIEKRYKTCNNAREKTRWHLIWIMATPEITIKIIEAARIVGFCERWARTIVRRYNQEWPTGLEDKRKNNPGQEPALKQEQKEELRKKIINERPADGGLWTSVKVANWIEEKTEKRPKNRTGLNYLRELGFSLQQPRPSNIKAASKEEIEEYKKNGRRSRENKGRKSRKKSRNMGTRRSPNRIATNHQKSLVTQRKKANCSTKS